MTKNEKILCWVYALISIAALYATWSHNFAFGAQPDNGGTIGFIRSLYVNHASASITNDLIFFGFAAAIFMVTEARRLNIRFVWTYLFFSLFIAVAVVFPLFLIARQMKLSEVARLTHNSTQPAAPVAG
jgi:hypothetical protein